MLLAHILGEQALHKPATSALRMTKLALLRPACKKSLVVVAKSKYFAVLIRDLMSCWITRVTG